MAEDKRVAFVGAGAMGGSIARGLMRSGAVAPAALAVADLNPTIRASFEAEGAKAFADAQDLIGAFDPELVVIAVKPQVLEAVVRPLASALAGRLVVSIAAGVTIATLEGLMGEARVVRCMPNLPMQVSSGAVAITAGTNATADDVSCVRELLSTLGVARVMREDQLDAAGVICGCAPAFFALFVDALTRAGIEAGMVAADAREMVASTMRGTAEQLLAGGLHPRAYMELVTSPGGTTIKALRAMEPLLVDAVEDGVDAALAKTRELAGK